MKNSKHSKIVVLFAVMLLMQIPQSCKAYDSKELICFVGEKLIIGFFAAVSAGLTYQGFMKIYNPQVHVEKKHTNLLFLAENNQKTIRTTSQEATQENTLEEKLKYRPLFDSHETIQGVGLVVVGTTLGRLCYNWMKQ